MKKKILKVLGVATFAFLSLLIEANASTIKYNSGFDTLKESLIDAYGVNYEEELKNNKKQYEVAVKIDELFKSEYGENYPSYFGGLYISDDSKNLIVQIIEKNIPDESSVDYKIYKEIISMDEAIIVEKVKNSYKNLATVKELIEKNSNNSINNNIASSYIDVKNNNIVVELLDNSIAKQKAVTNEIIKDRNELNVKNESNMYSDLISFKLGTMKQTTAVSDLKPGQKIAITSTKSCSMGFRMMYNGKRGYLTAGHCAYWEGLNSSITTGIIRLIQYKNNQNYDYAFIESNNLYNPVNRLAYGKDNMSIYQMDLTVNNNSTPIIVSGMAISKVGYTTKYTSGKIKNLNVSANYSGTTINGLISSDFKADSGDSGGAVFAPTSNYTATPIGILSGRSKDYSSTYFTSITSLPSSLTRY